MMYGLKEETYNLLIETLKKYIEIEKAYIFGSRAMGNYKKGSDIDICICGKSITESTISKSKLNIELNENLPIPYYFDIIYYDNIKNDNLRNHIDTEGIRIL